MEEIIERWKASMENRGLSSLTVNQYMNIINRFSEYLKQAQFTLDTVTAENVANWLKNSAQISKRKYISILKNFYEWALDKELVRRNIMNSKELKSKIPKKVRDTLTDSDIDTVDKYLRKEFSLRDRTLFQFMLGSGARRFEVVQVRVEDLNFDLGLVLLNGKGKKQRLVPLPDGILKMLKKYMNTAGIKSGVLFPPTKGRHWMPDREELSDAYISKIFATAKKDLNLPYLHPHVTRHTCATRLINGKDGTGGADINTVKEILGHESIATTQIYTHQSIAKTKNEVKKYGYDVKDVD